MPHYMLAVHTPTAAPDEPSAAQVPPDADEMAARMAALDQLESRMRDAGIWTASARLHDPSTATVVRRDAGETLLTDGPYLETTEHVAGYYVIEAADLDDALAWTAEIIDVLGMPALEVRPLAGYQA